MTTANTPISPYTPASDHVRSIVLDLVLTLLLCGLWNLVVQHRQMRAVNAMLKQDRYHFIPWLFFSLITCGLYHIYHEYRKSSDICHVMGTPDSSEPVISVLLTALGFHVVADAIQQTHINRFYGSEKL
jgi:hypothetical protein